MKRFIVLIGLLFLISCSSNDKVKMTYAWSSDYPHLIDHYELQAKINNNTWKTIISSVEDTTATFTTDNGDTVQIRVRAFDIIDRFSDWSEESNSDIADLDAPIIFPIN